MRVTVACVQNCAGNDMLHNIDEASTWVQAAAADGAKLICLPENFSFLEANDKRSLAGAYAEEDHPALPVFSELAATTDTCLVLGSLTIRLPDGKVNNRCYVIDQAGQIVARYNKIHLFDVSLQGGEAYKESSTVAAGDQASLAATPWGAMGLSICYDLRFAYLYRALAQAGAVFLTVPAAFTRTTGQAHWHVLVRARAIETGCFVLAPGQCGVRPNGRATFGHSLIVDPWGKVLADAGDEPGYVCAEVDTDQVNDARAMIPSLLHDRSLPPVSRSGEHGA